MRPRANDVVIELIACLIVIASLASIVAAPFIAYQLRVGVVRLTYSYPP